MKPILSKLKMLCLEVLLTDLVELLPWFRVNHAGNSLSSHISRLPCLTTHTLFLFCLIFQFILQILKNILNAFSCGASLEPTFVPFKDRFESILDHMLCAILPHFSWDLCPFCIKLLGEFEQGYILLKSPFFLIKGWVEMVEPFFAALVWGLEEGSIGTKIENVGDIRPSSPKLIRSS